MHYRGIVARLLCVAGVLIGTGQLAAEEPGELFPNVKSYDEQVPEPVTKPEKSLEKPKLPPAPAPQKTVPPIVPPRVIPEGPPTPLPAPVKPEFRVSWASYRTQLLAPLMSPTSQARFDKEFAQRVQASLHQQGSAAAAAADELWRAGEAPGLPSDLKMVVWLHALGLSIRDSSKLDLSATRAKTVLPLLTADTLPVAQARVDAVTGLAFGALTKASDDLLAIALESECKLARMQVQCGFPDEAQVNGKLASDIYGYLHEKTEPQKNMLSATQAWVERARQAQILSPQWQEILRKNPADAAVNTQLAVLNLSLFGDVQGAAKYAAKSERKEIKDFAAVAERIQPRAQDQTLNAADTLALAGALLNVAERGGAVPIDMFSIAMLAQEKLAELSSDSGIPPAQIQLSRTLQTRATSAAARSGVKMPAFTALAGLQNPSAGGGASKLQLFVKDNGTVVRYVKPTATENAQALSLVRTFAKEIGAKADLKFVEVETDHCLVFTDWDAGQRAFLKKNVEGAYVAVAKAFDYPLQDNVFPGKLPVFMLASQTEFLQFTKAASGREAYNNTGLFSTTDSGIGYVIMYQPESRNDNPDIIKDWGRTLLWDMGYAFEARYRTNKSFPTWLNQGLAAHLAYVQFPSSRLNEAVHDYADEGRTVEQLFTRASSDFEAQCVCASMVQMFMAADKKAFIQMLNKLKDGETQQDALQETYHWTPASAAKIWKNWVFKPLPDGGDY